jgi:hypothetical protein
MKRFNCAALLDFFLNTAGALPSIKQERRYNLIVIITNPVTKPIEKKRTRKYENKQRRTPGSNHRETENKSEQ